MSYGSGHAATSLSGSSSTHACSPKKAARSSGRRIQCKTHWTSLPLCVGPRRTEQPCQGGGPLRHAHPPSATTCFGEGVCLGGWGGGRLAGVWAWLPDGVVVSRLPSREGCLEAVVNGTTTSGTDSFSYLRPGAANTGRSGQVCWFLLGSGRERGQQRWVWVEDPGGSPLQKKLP